MAGFNGFGLHNEIAINSKHLQNREFWRVLGTLLHELLHAWQHMHGHPSGWAHHNIEFRSKAKEYGLIVSRRGVTDYETGPFTALLEEQGVHIPEIPEPPQCDRGSSKLGGWTCGCTNARVAVADFYAKCLRCGNLFTPGTTRLR